MPYVIGTRAAIDLAGVEWLCNIAYNFMPDKVCWLAYFVLNASECQIFH